MSIIYPSNGPIATARRYGSGGRCTVRGCDGEIARHSLGCGMATRRCTRCFKRYDVVEDFEMALFGRDVRTGREPDGVMAVDSNPPWAGVLAFPAVSPASVVDPVLFVAPAYTGPLPASVDRVEVRRLGPNGVAIQEARDTDVMVGMRWAAH